MDAQKSGAPYGTILELFWAIMRLVNALVLSGAAGWFLASELGK